MKTTDETKRVMAIEATLVNDVVTEITQHEPFTDGQEAAVRKSLAGIVGRHVASLRASIERPRKAVYADETMDTRGPKELAYDEYIEPLVAQLVELSDRHEIPVILLCELDPSDDGHKVATVVNEGESFMSKSLYMSRVLRLVTREG